MTEQPKKALLFDFGNVLLPLDIEATYNAFEKLGAKATLHKDLPFFYQWERGEISAAVFTKELAKHLQFATHSSSIWQAWSAMILPLPPANIELLQHLKKRYKLILVSNINEEHEGYIKNMMGPFIYRKFLKQFQSIYYSHHIGRRKPEEAFFKHVLDAEKLDADACFFIDDTLANIEVAQNLGIQSWHFNPMNDSLLKIEDKLAEWAD